MYKKLGFKIIDLLRGTRALSVFEELSKKQYLPPEQVENESTRLMEIHFNRVIKSVPFYRNDKRYCNISTIPYLEKENVKSQYNDFFVDGVDRTKAVKKTTGGSTGSPFTYYTSKESQSYLWAGILLSWSAAGYEIGDKVAMVAGASLFRNKSFSQKIYYSLMNVVLMDANSLTKSTCKKYIHDLKVKKVKFIYGYASAIFELSKVVIELDLQLKIKSVITTSEVLTPVMRTTIEKAFKTEVFDQYGCNDAGLAAFECEEHNGLHLNTLRSHISIDEDGCVYSTDLVNDVMPLLNYSTGDLIEYSEDKCACGRGFPLLKSIKGRSNDMIKTRDGDLLHSSYFNKLFSLDESIQTYQAIFNNEKLFINLIVENNNENKINIYFFKNEIEKKLKKVDIRFSLNDRLIRLDNGKIKNLIVK